MKDLYFSIGLAVFLIVEGYALPQLPQGGADTPAAVLGTGIRSNTFYYPHAQTSSLLFVSELDYDSKIVKGAPFSATLVIDHELTLHTGVHITRRSQSHVYRDSQGRVRREQIVDDIQQALSSSNPRLQSVIIDDPIAALSYILNPEDRTASMTKLPSPLISRWSPDILSFDASNALTMRIGRLMVGTIDSRMPGPTTIRPLGKKEIEALPIQSMAGVDASGTRITETIYSQTIGNDGPIVIVTERWYSADLGMCVKIIVDDPISGKAVYQLMDIRHAEPDARLFRVPGDYTLK